MHRYLQLALTALLFALPASLSAQQVNDLPPGTPVQSSAVFGVAEGCPTVFGTLGSGSPQLPAVSGLQTGRVWRDATPSTCAAPKGWPGLFGAGTPYPFDAYTLTNTTGSAQCVTMTILTTAGQMNHLMVYAGSFDPANVSANYLADSGSSSIAGTLQGLSVTVAAGQTIVVVVLNPLDQSVGATYELTYDKICGPVYDATGLDDKGNGRLCFNSTTGDFQWTVLSGPYAGTVIHGKANVTPTATGLILSTAPGAYPRLRLDYSADRRKAAATLVTLDFRALLWDSNTEDSSMAPCLPAPEAQVLNGLIQR